TLVRASISARSDGVSVCVSRPALTARPSGEPCEVSITNRTSFSASISLAATCNDLASASIVALPPLFELYCTLIGPFPNRLATIAEQRKRNCGVTGSLPSSGEPRHAQSRTFGDRGADNNYCSSGCNCVGDCGCALACGDGAGLRGGVAIGRGGGADAFGRGF